MQKSIDPTGNLKELFFDVLDKEDIQTVFQPIVSLRDGSVFGYEALSRGPKDTEVHSPETLFALAQKYDRLWELELLCRSKALERVNESQIAIKLFLNVNPNIMHDKEFKQGFTREYLSKYNIDPENIIFEITEREAVNNVNRFKKAIKNYKDQNYKIAVDDAGAGYSGLNLISDIYPHFIKLDMNLVRDIDKDTTKQSLIRSLCEFALLTNTYLIAEGIETEKELLKLIEIGVHYGQGYYLQRPNASILPIGNNITGIIIEANVKKNHLSGSKISDIYINNISLPLKTLRPNILIAQVYHMLNSDSTLPGFCITDNERILGVITRNGLFSKISGAYGYSVFSNKTIASIMSRDFMHIDHKTPIDIVAKVAMQRPPDQLYDFITITKDDKYLGIVTVKDLLEKTIQIEITNAKHLNPLSELPGNILIERYLENCLTIPDYYCVLYFDIDNFKAYNDVYGFEKGDLVIKSLAQILKTNFSADEFIGHIGGDDFIAVTFSVPVENICDKIIEEFSKSISNFYSQTDISNGYIVAKNRHGIEETFPLLSLSIAGVTSKHNFTNIYDISEKASQIKKICKQNFGSNYIIV